MLFTNYLHTKVMKFIALSYRMKEQVEKSMTRKVHFMKTAIVTDSTAYIPKETRERLNIHMIPLSVIFGGEVYQEEVEITAAEFYEEVKSKGELPTTSQPPVGKFVELFQELSKEYDAVISVHLSSGISGTYNGAVTAGQMAESIKVYAFDSEVSCMVQGFYAIEAAEMAALGKTPEEIIERLNEVKQSISAYFMVDDLSHLQRGGRLSGAQALIGSLLQVKPILHFVDKLIVPFEKIRTRKKALNRIYDLFDEEASKGRPMRAVIIHANRPDEAESMKAELEAKYPHVEYSISYFGPVIGTHLGEGAMGLGWYTR
ncbi:DegV family protein with EDD domain [Metabacillus sp. SLBN-84]